MMALASELFLDPVPGFRSGDCAGQSSAVMPSLDGKCFVTAAVWQGALSCMKM